MMFDWTDFQGVTAIFTFSGRYYPEGGWREPERDRFIGVLKSNGDMHFTRMYKDTNEGTPITGLSAWVKYEYRSHGSHTRKSILVEKLNRLNPLGKRTLYARLWNLSSGISTNDRLTWKNIRPFFGSLKIWAARGGETVESLSDRLWYKITARGMFTDADLFQMLGREWDTNVKITSSNYFNADNHGWTGSLRQDIRCWVWCSSRRSYRCNISDAQFYDEPIHVLGYGNCYEYEVTRNFDVGWSESRSTYVIMHEYPEAEEGEEIPANPHYRTTGSLYGYHNGPRNYGQITDDRIGVELEVLCADNLKRIEFVKSFQDEKLFIMERDGSLDDWSGMEIIGPPLTFSSYDRGDQNNIWPSILERLRNDGAKSWSAGNRAGYGMHINYSRSNLSWEQQALCVLLVNRHKELFRSVSGRESTYAAFGNYPTYSIADLKATYDSCYDRLGKYSAVYIHGPVMEFRLFRGTLAWDGFRRNIQCVQSVVDFVKWTCAGLTNHALVALENYDKDDAYLKFVEDNRAKYPQLREFLYKRKWIVDARRVVDTKFSQHAKKYAA